MPGIGNERATPSVDDHLPIIASDQIALPRMLKKRGVVPAAARFGDGDGVTLENKLFPGELVARRVPKDWQRER